MDEEQQPTDEVSSRARTRPRVRSAAILLAIVVGTLIVAGYLLRGQAPRAIAILTELGVWAAITTGRRWTVRDLLERLGNGSTRLAAAASRATRLA